MSKMSDLAYLATTALCVLCLTSCGEGEVDSSSSDSYQQNSPKGFSVPADDGPGSNTPNNPTPPTQPAPTDGDDDDGSQQSFPSDDDDTWGDQDDGGSPTGPGDDDDTGGTSQTPPVQDDGLEMNVGWIGGACASSADCSNPSFNQPPQCLTDGFENGFCTQSCSQAASGNWVCPDTTYGQATGNSMSRCIDGNGAPQCVTQCDFDLSPTGCRPGYACVLRQRYGTTQQIFPVCLPRPEGHWPGAPVPAFDIGAACNTHADCSHLDCIPWFGGYCSKSMCDNAQCPAGSSCFTFSDNTTGCLADCTHDSQCRTEHQYYCSSPHGACIPDPTPPSWNPAVGANDCLEAWGNAGDGLSPCDTVKDNYVVVRKSARNVALCQNGSLVANYHAGLGFSPVGHKYQEGDGRTPEGVYYIPRLLPNSSFYKAFLLSYPDIDDAWRGFNNGLITASTRNNIINAQNNCTEPPQATALGGLIEIHGHGGGEDWTLGCVAIENNEVDVLWGYLGVGDTIVVLP